MYASNAVHACVHVFIRVCVRACARARVRACVRACFIIFPSICIGLKMCRCASGWFLKFSGRFLWDGDLEDISKSVPEMVITGLKSLLSL